MDDRLEPPLGLLYIGTWAAIRGYPVEICDLAGIPMEGWHLPEADYYGFVTYSTTYARTLALVTMARSVNPNALMIAGGPHASALPEQVLQDFDYVVVGEGENALLEILCGEAAPGIIIGKPVMDLDLLPMLDYGLVDIDSYHRIVDGKKSFTLLSSRGCPHKCLFCNSLIMGGHKPLRFRSPELVVDEMGALRAFGDVAYRFGDDLFGGSRRWLDSFAQELDGAGISYRAFVRLNQCASPLFVQRLVETGCKHIAVGAESGSDKILRAMSKGLTKQVSREGIRRAKEAGLIVRTYWIVGFPGETWDTVKETVEFIDETMPDEFVVYPLIPYPGTPIYHDPEKYGLLNIDHDFSKYFQICGDKHSEFVYDLQNADRVELQAMKDYMVGELEKMQISWAIGSKGYI
jgi:anaerobic magnesium-protoporphyrin IX monomethyl ester cyclase